MKNPRSGNGRLTVLCLTSSLLGGVALACAAERRSTPEPTYAELRQNELASERREFISDTQKRLATITNDMDLLRVKLEHESPYVNKDQRAEWSQELFELGQERDRLRGELDRAQTASAAEWEQMRGPLGVATDSLQARVSKIGIALSGSTNQDVHNEAPVVAQSGLCPVTVDGIEADVEKKDRTLVVMVTTDNAKSVPTLQARAQKLADADNYPLERPRTTDRAEAPFSAEGGKNAAGTASAIESNGMATPVEAIPVKITVENINDGARLVFAPTAGKLDELQARLQTDAERLEEGLCRAPNEVSLHQTSSK